MDKRKSRPQGAASERSAETASSIVARRAALAAAERADAVHATSAPLARAVGRYVQTAANHTSIAVMVALRLALASYRPRGCFNADGQPKVRHKSREAAIAHKRSLILAGRASKWLQVYQCSVCGFWLVGHRGGRR